MYYHNLNVIRKGSKKLLTIKISKILFLTPSTYIFIQDLFSTRYWCASHMR